MSEKLVNFRFDEEGFEDLKDLARKERVSLKSLLTSILSDYIKNHKDGNPQYTIEQSMDLNFMACPAFFRDSKAWENYLQNHPEEAEKIKNQILLIEKVTLRYL